MNTTAKGFGDMVANLGTPLYPQLGPMPQSEAPTPAAPTATADSAPVAPAIDYGTWLLYLLIAAGAAWYFWPEQAEGIYQKVKGLIS